MTDSASEGETVLTSELRCPHCDYRQREVMPTTACLYFYECLGCGVLLKPKLGDCCVFCSYGDVPCPPVQSEAGSCRSLDRGEEAAATAALLSSVLNPGVLSSQSSRSAFEAILRQGFEGKHSQPLTGPQSIVLSHVLEFYSAFGRAPAPTELASSSGLSVPDLQRSIAELIEMDFLVVDETRRLCGAYPFTDHHTPHRVIFTGTGSTVYAMCAVDALGAGAMVDQDIEIHSSCAVCQSPVMALTTDSGKKLAVVYPPATVVRVGETPACSCAAETLCPAIEFVCCKADGTAQMDRGLTVSVANALEVGRALFENRARAVSK